MQKDKRNKNKFKSFGIKFRNLLSNQAILYGVIVTLVLFIMMYVIFRTEETTNSDINSFFDAFWYTLVTITTVGYGDITPESVGGRLAGIFLLIGGVAIFGGFSGKFASILFGQQLKKDRGLIQLTKMKNHFLICGWKAGYEKILEGVLEANPEIPVEQIVLINTVPSQEMDRIKADKRFHNMNYLCGDFSDEETLLRANIKNAERALVLSDSSDNFSPLEVDSRTVLAVLTMKNLNPRMYTAAELIDAKFEKHLAIAHCDEIILSTDYERNLVVQASSGMGLSHVLRELISNDSETGLVIKDISKEFIGKNYGEYRKSLCGSDVLIGVLENTGNFYHRRREALAEAQKNPNMKKIVDNLKKVKLLKSNLPTLAPKDDYIIPQNSKAIFVKGSCETDELQAVAEEL